MSSEYQTYPKTLIERRADGFFVGAVEITVEPERDQPCRRRRRPRSLSEDAAVGLGLAEQRPNGGVWRYDRHLRVHQCACGAWFIGHRSARLCSAACLTAARETRAAAERARWVACRGPKPPSKA